MVLGEEMFCCYQTHRLRTTGILMNSFIAEGQKIFVVVSGFSRSRRTDHNYQLLLRGWMYGHSHFCRDDQQLSLERNKDNSPFRELHRIKYHDGSNKSPTSFPSLWFSLRKNSSGVKKLIPKFTAKCTSASEWSSSLPAASPHIKLSSIFTSHSSISFSISFQPPVLGFL
jgi:hypothetical protein